MLSTNRHLSDIRSRITRISGNVKPTGIPVIDEVVAEATGHGDRVDPNLPHTGGPAGNATLTAWTGLLLLALILAELVTLVDVTGLIRWHVAIGILLTAMVGVKIASVGWRMLRYYTRSEPYHRAGPPPLVLRVLGPLVIVSTLGVLGSGIAMISVGSSAASRPLITMLGQSVNLEDLHQFFFVLFAVVVGLHLIARFVPALGHTTARRGADGGNALVAGRSIRIAVLSAAILAAVIALILVLPSVSGWQDEHHFDHDFEQSQTSPQPELLPSLPLHTVVGADG
ncbi:MAG: hypothetical protein ABI382_07575 [Nakamurella sp.]